jgi:hypothetical protein
VPGHLADVYLHSLCACLSFFSSFAKEIFVDGVRQYDCRARLSSGYLSFESLHLFNVQPNTVHVVSNYIPGVGNQWQVLPPGSHSFSSPFMKSMALISTSIQGQTMPDTNSGSTILHCTATALVSLTRKHVSTVCVCCLDLIIKEERVSTQDGIQLANVAAVLSYQIRMENVSKMLAFDVSNYRTIIEDWAKRTMVSCNMQILNAPGRTTQRAPAGSRWHDGV